MSSINPHVPRRASRASSHLLAAMGTLLAVTGLPTAHAGDTLNPNVA